MFGTLATMIARPAHLAHAGQHLAQGAAAVLCNAVIVGLVLTYAYGIDMLWLNMLTVAWAKPSCAICWRAHGKAAFPPGPQPLAA